MADMPPVTFKAAMTEMIASVDYDWIIECDRQPVALVLGASVAAGRGVDLQVDWLPWATARQHLEGAASFIVHASKQLKLFIYADSRSEPLFARLATRYRMLRKGCRITNYYGGGEDAMFFYSPGPF